MRRDRTSTKVARTRDNLVLARTIPEQQEAIAPNHQNDNCLAMQPFEYWVRSYWFKREPERLQKLTKGICIIGGCSQQGLTQNTAN